MSTPTRYLRFAVDGYCEWTDGEPTVDQLRSIAGTAWTVLRITPDAIVRLAGFAPAGGPLWHPVKPSEGDDQFPTALAL